MPLLEISSITSTGASFCIAFAFLSAETEEDFKWGLLELKYIYEGVKLPQVIVTDRDLACVNNAIDSNFSHAKHLLCSWHTQKQDLANCKSHYEQEEEFEKFQGMWNNVMNSESETMFNSNLSELMKVSSQRSFKYLNDTWLPWKKRYQQRLT